MEIACKSYSYHHVGFFLVDIRGDIQHPYVIATALNPLCFKAPESLSNLLNDVDSRKKPRLPHPIRYPN